MFRERDAITSMVISGAQQNGHNHGIEMTSEIEHAKRLDGKNSNTFWIKAIEKDVRVLGIAFKILDEESPILVGHKNITSHLIF